MKLRSLLVVVLLVAGCSAAPPPSEAAPCGSSIVTDALPEWARTGFSDDGAGVPHVFGRGGDILAVLFGNPLKATPDQGRANKILWVSRLPAKMGDTLRITATLDGATPETVDRKVDGGPGPSIVDLPKPGCWRLTLKWQDRTDTMDLTYS